MDYTATIPTSAPPDRAAQMITDDLERWWSTRVDRHPDGFTIRFNRSHVTFAYGPGGTPDHFSWTCTDAHMIMDDVDDPTEWTGTRLVWQIAPANGGSTVTLTHEGLTPQIACFDICRRGWQHFFEASLRNHLNGAPAMPETSAPAA
ncbi:SRPBCC domain-containing protein [uncultured Tateyamaria sp.]|uniref:SRPBCC family protein n=1 Tax=uncultured Tateyamaria sp. TaxID=455651 RepID=UPI00263424E1|nr:SRPBCC domain-containing protein [uncultured Tateyamaria sp.]